MKFDFWVAVVHLPSGFQTHVINELSDTVYFQDGDFRFEAEAHHLGGWCIHHGYYLAGMTGTLPQGVL